MNPKNSKKFQEIQLTVAKVFLFRKEIASNLFEQIRIPIQIRKWLFLGVSVKASRLMRSFVELCS